MDDDLQAFDDALSKDGIEAGLQYIRAVVIGYANGAGGAWAWIYAGNEVNHVHVFRKPSCNGIDARQP